MPRVIFVCPAASRSGAPLSLLHLLRRLRRDDRLQFSLLVMNDGPLSAEFEKVCPVVRAGRHAIGLRRRILGGNPDLIYVNTVAGGSLLRRLAPLPCPVVAHIHELEFALVVHKEHFGAIRSFSDRYIAVSQAVRDNLVERHEISPERIDTIYEVFEPIERTKALEETGLALRRGLGIAEHAFVIGCAGSVEMRKGPDLFIQLAATLLRLRREWEIHFIWVGHCTDNVLRAALAEDVRKAGLAGRVHFVGEHSDPAGYYASFDLFALMSREDPFPLVCLEAASLAKPILCFSGAGGMAEFVSKGAGEAVSYLDVPAMAEAALKLFDNAAVRRERGAQAAALARGKFSPESTVPQLREVILKAARSGPRQAPALD